mmetsp:Transcript_2040/g.1485  ORF Transcript_2040/g.1485 Transcript_2040/m.1485 type:complete len:101 (+) Transcript_2040:277-579(+)
MFTLAALPFYIGSFWSTFTMYSYYLHEMWLHTTLLSVPMVLLMHLACTIKGRADYQIKQIDLVRDNEHDEFAERVAIKVMSGFEEIVPIKKIMPVPSKIL